MEISKEFLSEIMKKDVLYVNISNNNVYMQICKRGCNITTYELSYRIKEWVAIKCGYVLSTSVDGVINILKGREIVDSICYGYNKEIESIIDISEKMFKNKNTYIK